MLTCLPQTIRIAPPELKTFLERRRRVVEEVEVEKEEEESVDLGAAEEDQGDTVNLLAGTVDRLLLPSTA